MATKIKGKKPVPLADIIEEEAREAERESMGADPSFDPDRDLNFGHGPSAFSHNMRDKDQLVIDELLASLPKNQGYYLKLYKEILPGKWELKERIDQYETWTDMELEIAERVKAMTRKFGAKKWGSALYRVVVWRNGGIREKNKYLPVDIIVDAGDDVDAAANTNHARVDPAEAANEQMHALGNMLKAVETIMPRAVDPNIQFQAIVQAFTAGKGEKENKDNMMLQMMMTMMTTMMASMKDLALAGRQSNTPEPKPFEEQMARMMAIMKEFGLGQPPMPKGLAEQMAELKLLGFDPFKKEDTIEQIAKLKALTGTLMDVMPQGGQTPERPGIFEKLIDAVAPHVPKIFSDIRAITDNAALAQKMQAIRAAQQPQAIPMDARPTTSYGQPVGPQPNRMGAGDAFSQPPDMDPYSGFTTRPFQNPTEQDAGIEMFGSVNGASAEDLRARHLKASQPQQAQPVQPPPQPVQPQPVIEQPQVPVELPPVLQQLHGLINENIVEAYGPLYETLLSFPESMEMVKAIQGGLANGAVITGELVKTGFPQFTHPPFIEKARSYLDGFVQWVLANTTKKVEAVCQTCHAVHIFDNMYEFEKSDKMCGAEVGGNQQCAGHLALKEKHEPVLTSA